MANVVSVLFSEFVVGYFSTLKPTAPKRERFVDGHANSLYRARGFPTRRTVGYAYQSISANA